MSWLHIHNPVPFQPRTMRKCFTDSQGFPLSSDRYEGVHLCQSFRDNKWDAEAEGRAFGKLVIGSAQAAEQAKA